MILSAFRSEAELADALQRLQAAGLRAPETHTPAPPGEGDTHSFIRPLMLVAGLVGAAGGFAMQAYAHTAGYRMDIGGRPDFFWPAYVPFAFEAGLLLALLAGFLGFLIGNRLPALYDPIDESSALRTASRNLWFLALRQPSAQEAATVRTTLAELQPLLVEELAP